MNAPLFEQTSLWPLLSPLARRMETPQGIFYWSARAKVEAEIDGTIGVAQDDDGSISHLPIAEAWAGPMVMKRVSGARVFGYAPIPGMESLRKKWLARMLETHPRLRPHALLSVVTNGITHSLALSGRLLLEEGQTIITAEKSWENYAHIFSDAQGVRIREFSLFDDGRLNIPAVIEACRDVAELQKKVVLLLNFPHNQTGYMPSLEEFQELGKRLKDFCEAMPDIPFALVLDDAYEGYVYDEIGLKCSPASELFVEEPNFCMLKLDGISKVMLAYGYRIAFITAFLSPAATSLQVAASSELHPASPFFSSTVGGFIRAEISQPNHHGQILADALMDEWEEVSRQRAFVIGRLAERWRAMQDAVAAQLLIGAREGGREAGREKSLRSVPAIRPDPCNGGFFGYFNLAPNIDPKKVADRLLKEKRIGVVPSGQGLRAAFCGVAKEKIPRMIAGIFEVVGAM